MLRERLQPMPSFKFICATPKPKQIGNEPLFYNIFKLKNENIQVSDVVEYGNIRGLPDIYNEHSENSEEDFLIFIHDDVIINDIEFFDKILKYSSMFDVMGVAGTASLNMSGAETLSWMCATNKSHLTCNVTHPEKESNTLYSLNTNYGFAPRLSISIDGLIIIASKKAYKSIKFDPRFKFDFYDMDYCMSLYDKGLKLGVIPIPVTHLSGGYGILKPSYKDTQILFKQKWCK